MQKIHIIKEKATAREIEEMLESLSSYIKLAVDIECGVIAGGRSYSKRKTWAC